MTWLPYLMVGCMLSVLRFSELSKARIGGILLASVIKSVIPDSGAYYCGSCPLESIITALNIVMKFLRVRSHCIYSQS
jgi:hypothetical protein